MNNSFCLDRVFPKEERRAQSTSKQKEEPLLNEKIVKKDPPSLRE